MTEPGLVHFFSYVTGVSLELPVGFEFDGEDDVSASYADRVDDEPVTSATPVVRVRVVGQIEGDAGPAAVRGLADGFGGADRETVGRRDRAVDGSRAVTVVSRDSGRVLHQTAIAADDRLLSVIASAPTDELLPVYDAAIDSIRIIAL
jgi:hypothetical protein